MAISGALPDYPDNRGASPISSAELAKLRWRCRRGMKELDVLLGRWLEARYSQVSSAEQAVFQSLLELPDPQVARYLLGREQPADAPLRALVAAILTVRPPAT
jgi:antitoxin CptB